MPQQQRKAGWSALPAHKGEETSGHVELNYVLTCPSPSPLGFSEGESKKRGKKRKRIFAKLEL